VKPWLRGDLEERLLCEGRGTFIAAATRPAAARAYPALPAMAPPKRCLDEGCSNAFAQHDRRRCRRTGLLLGHGPCRVNRVTERFGVFMKGSRKRR
jgi:hypothetical protein